VHWIWTRAEPTPIPGLDGALDTLDLAGFTRNVGLPMRAAVPVIELSRAPVPPDALADHLGIPGFDGLIFSRRLRTLLDAAGIDNVQYFPCWIRTTGPDMARDMPPNFVVANVVGRVACIDRDASLLETDAADPAIIEFVEQFVIDEDAVAGIDLFRLAEIPRLLVASDRVKDACERANITGAKFVPVDQYSD
jgi:hypothetical protein